MNVTIDNDLNRLGIAVSYLHRDHQGTLNRLVGALAAIQMEDKVPTLGEAQALARFALSGAPVEPIEPVIQEAENGNLPSVVLEP